MTRTDSAPFVHEQRAHRVVFGAGAFGGLSEEVERLGARRVVVVGSKRTVESAVVRLGRKAVLVVDDPVMHVPATQVRAVLARAEEAEVDAVVAVGGGSAIGLAKALALRAGLTVLAVPTTYSGSEMTRVWGITEEGVKTTGKDPAVAPRTVIYDPELLTTLPPALAVPSAFNAMAHAVEALWAPDRNPFVDALAREGIRGLVRSLPGLASGDPAAPGEALYGAWLCGVCLDSTTMSLHHKLCHVLGGTLGLPHAPTHTAVLPYVVAFNAPRAPRALGVLQEVLGTEDPALGLFQLQQETGARRSLADLGMRESDLDRVTGLVLASPYANPYRPDASDIKHLLRSALTGAPPSVVVESSKT
ncbi:maleylacetate reductase [Streptomyces sp. NPDC020951]|uniref:maleylacetate reductase n=1 Tax=Streptomyces sp. NPDC020951 TaxID=3365104 RepID=UPI0037A0C670